MRSSSPAEATLGDGYPLSVVGLGHGVASSLGARAAEIAASERAHEPASAAGHGGRHPATRARVMLVAALVTGLLSAACRAPEMAPERTTVDAPVSVVERTALPTLHTVAGTVRSRNTSTLSANVIGTIVSVTVNEGDAVKAGDVLVAIDAREPVAQLDRARAGREEVERAIEGATANVQLTEATFRRYEALHERGVASRQDLDEARARHVAAQAELNRLAARRGEARAAATQAGAVLDFSSIRAPIAGIVTARFVDPGAQAAPGVPLLTIEEARATRVDAYLPEGVLARIGDRVFVDAGGQRVPARVTHVQPALDSGSRSSLVKLELDQPLRSGAFVKVLISTGSRDTITVPNTALVRRGALTSVFVVDAQHVARMRLITVGSTDAARTEVLSGLDAGETIVIAPANVRDGVIVRSGA